MATSINIPQKETSTPLGALVSHFNASSKSVRNAFVKMLKSAMEQEERAQLQAKMEKGMQEIREGRGICRKEEESTEEFFERLCTE
ncbi:MAG: hypothetical protein Q4D33_08610 [Prevotellaceae bacterium]|nr:hypothetical protein [Prevotellaceae bacterium]